MGHRAVLTPPAAPTAAESQHPLRTKSGCQHPEPPVCPALPFLLEAPFHGRIGGNAQARACVSFPFCSAELQRETKMQRLRMEK